MVENESLGVVDEDVLVLNAGRVCEDDLVPDEVDAVLPLAAGSCDLAGGCDAASALPRQLGTMTKRHASKEKGNALTRAPRSR